VLGGPESGGPGGGGGPVLACPLQCGLDPVALPFLRAHLVAFHGCDLDSIKVTEAKVKICVLVFHNFLSSLISSVADPDPGSDAFFNPDHISESFKTIFGLKYLNYLMRIRIRDGKKFVSGIRNTVNQNSYRRVSKSLKDDLQGWEEQRGERHPGRRFRHLSSLPHQNI
jgi:hypothetical protein